MQYQSQRGSNQIVLLNNRGVFCLEQGNTEAAIIHISEAFQQSKTLFHETILSGAARSCKDRNDCTSLLLIDYLLTQQQQQRVPQEAREVSCLDAACCCSRSGPQSTFVYDRALSLPDMPSELIASSHSIMLSIISAVLFNLALAHHQAAVTLVSSTDDANNDNNIRGRGRLAKAAKLYELAFQLQQNERSQSRSTLFLMVVLNNLGGVYRFLGHEVAADTCFAKLLSMTMHFIVNNTRHADGPPQQQQQQAQQQTPPSVSSSSSTLRIVEGFITSTSYLIWKDQSHPAAAA